MPLAVLRLHIVPLLRVEHALGCSGRARRAGTHAKSDKGIAYNWVDEQGVTHYGDHIPPQYATKERAILNTQGVEVGHLDAQKSPEQQAADAHARAELMKQKQHDAFLLTTYTSVKDIEALRDERLEQIRASVRGRAYMETLRTRLARCRSRALLFKPYSYRPARRRMPDDLAENLMRTLNEMRVQRRRSN